LRVSTVSCTRKLNRQHLDNQIAAACPLVDCTRLWTVLALPPRPAPGPQFLFPAPVFPCPVVVRRSRGCARVSGKCRGKSEETGHTRGMGERFAQCLVRRPPHDAHRCRVGRRAPTPTITTDRRLARPCGEQTFGSLRACRMLCDVWTLARNARKLAFHPWARGRTTVVGSLCDAPIGSSTSSPATSQHGSSLDGSLLSMLSAFCTASPGSL